MKTKALTIESMNDAGIGLARLATLSAVDSDGDTYQPGAFSWKEGGSQWAPMIVAHNRGMMPFGKSRVFEQDDAAFAELHLNLETQAGREWYEALKFDLAKGEPVQEWSYGYEVLDADFRYSGRTKIRVIKQTDVHEVSPVIRGAGLGTRTLGIKSAALKESRFAPLIGELGDLAAAIGADGEQLSATGFKQLADIHAALGKALRPSCAGCDAQFDPKDLTDGRCGPCIAGKDEGKNLAADAFGQFMHFQSRRHVAKAG